ncbi:Hypothetical protein R9X50_00412900 [Acrodontium crateriforme]|uniref:Non-hemolytic phospholipase C n=1 Tax=Acrodontium crateriforme TaxID=150365 RepID=A0AAQ3R9Z0_9PEZI|nr:Hypothetical protein R9X50_00412900 [Acrodontium crateriforme]
MSPLSLWSVVAAATTAYAAGSIADIEHVVLFMQENRAFDHYFGTMAGVRGFKDPNAQINPDGTSVFYQNTDAYQMSEYKTNAKKLLPWYLNYQHGRFDYTTQCMYTGSNSWDANHAAYNKGLNDAWVQNQTEYSWGHFTRTELPAHFAIAEGWTIGDMYQESVIASTNPNRVAWMSGSINSPGGPQSPSQGGMTIDNNETPGCEGTNLNCYPLKWPTAPEHWQNAGVTWQVYQDINNFDDNPLAWFQQFQSAAQGSELQQRGMTNVGLEKFYEDAANDNLPQISIIVGPAELSEHPPYQPRDGAWLQAKMVDTITSSPAYRKTAMIISYDETGGWGDHVVPYHAPNGTAAEWINDPYGNAGYTPIGPGYRVPFYIVSPWTRGGHVYTEHADHSSQIQFVEQWLAAKGVNVKTSEIPAWRRANMADLTKAFDFANPDYSIPNVPNITYPLMNIFGQYTGSSLCRSANSTVRPDPPYSTQNEKTALATEQGFKGVRGQLTEGRYLTFEMNGYALTSNKGTYSGTKTTAKHDSTSQRFVIHQSDQTKPVYTVKDLNGNSLGNTSYTINDMGNGRGYSLKRNDNNKYISINKNGSIQTSSSAVGFAVFSVSYDN